MNNNNNNTYMNDTRNLLDKDNYLISDNLHVSLQDGNIRSNMMDDRTVFITDNIYMVMVRVLHKEDRILVYNYTTYHAWFHDSLVYFLTNRSVNNDSIYKEPGNLLGVLDNSLQTINNNYITQDVSYTRLHVGNALNLLTKNIEKYGHLGMSNAMIFKLIYQMCVCGDTEFIARLIDLAVGKQYKPFIKEVFGLLDDPGSLDELVSKSRVLEVTNLINSCVFLVHNLDKFVDKVKDYGYNFNAGPQKYRGCINSINNSLSLLDLEYRKSLYLHHRHHASIGTIPSIFKLNKDKFSFNNIHSNLSGAGGVKWYSTTTKSKQPDSSTKKTKLLISKKSVNVQTSVFDQLAEYLKNLPINENTQKEIEEFLANYSKWLFIKKDKRNRKTISIDYSLISKNLTKLLIEKEVIIYKDIDNVRERSYDNKPTKKNEVTLYYLHTILKEMKNEFILSIMYGRLLRIISINEKLYNVESTICLELGRELVKGYHCCLYKKYKSSFEESNKEFYMSEWKKLVSETIQEYNDSDDNFTGSLGAVLIKWLLDADIVEETWIRKNNKETINILVPTENILSTLNDKNDVYYLPQNLPMIVKPKPYFRTKLSNGHNTERLGGYLLNDNTYTQEIIKQKWNNKRHTEIRDENVIYGLVNNINSVGFKINTDVLSFINTYRTQYDLIETDKQNYDHLLSKPKLKDSEYKELEAYLGKRGLAENILGIAKTYSYVHEFFLPVRLDFRGRLNCISEYLNYQSSELAKALLLFSKPEKIFKTDTQAIAYLKSYGANCFGNKLEKKSWNERVKWVDENMNDIINFTNGNLIKQSENKLMFIAFCFEFNRLLNSFDNVNSSYFETYLPVRLDATCNGYQHIALLSKDTNLAQQLNLTKSTKADPPKDFYSFIGASLVSLYKNKLISNNLNDLDRECYTRLSKLDVIRGILKRAVMVKPYNATPIKIEDSMKDNFKLNDYKAITSNIKSNTNIDKGQTILDRTNIIERWYELKSNTNIKLKERDFTLIRLGIEEILSNDVFKIRKLMIYLERVAKILTMLNLVIPWAAPQGVDIYQSYLSTKEIRLKPFTFSNKTFSLVVPDKEGKFNKTKQVRAFMPNLIHSLDAASLALLVDFYFNNSRSIDIKNIFTVHDCFAVTANNIENVMDLIKLVYTRIYSESNYLRKLDKGIIDHIKLIYKDVEFDDNKSELNINDEIIKYPSIEGVLGTSSTASDYIFDSSYIIH